MVKKVLIVFFVVWMAWISYRSLFIEDATATLERKQDEVVRHSNTLGKAIQYLKFRVDGTLQ